MLQTATVDLTANRWEPFVDPTDFEGYDYSAATFAMQVRLYRDAPGDPLISLTNATAGSQGVSVSVATDDDDQPISTVTIQIDEATLEAVLPFAVTSGSPNRKAGTDLELYYDLQITGGGHTKLRRMEGTFTIKAGVTR